MKPTSHDPNNATTELALLQLDEATKTRNNYDSVLQAAIVVHGDRHFPERDASGFCAVCLSRNLLHSEHERINHQTGALISGIYADHFPEFIKNELRTLAHNIGVQVEYAYVLWRKSGRRSHTLRPYADRARVLADGRISYY